MTFKQPEHIGITDPSNTIELWDDAGRKVATIYARTTGVHIMCEERWQPDEDGLQIERRPAGLFVGLRSS